MGRHAKPYQLDLDWDLQNLQERARVQYQTDALFHAKVQQAARILIRLHPDIYWSLRDATASALTILAAVDNVNAGATTPNTARERAGLPGLDPLGHRLAEDHNGDPVCSCGWNPANFFRPTSREDARGRIRSHIAPHGPRQSEQD